MNITEDRMLVDQVMEQKISCVIPGVEGDETVGDIWNLSGALSFPVEHVQDKLKSLIESSPTSASSGKETPQGSYD